MQNLITLFEKSRNAELFIRTLQALTCFVLRLYERLLEDVRHHGRGFEEAEKSLEVVTKASTRSENGAFDNRYKAVVEVEVDMLVISRQ